MHILIAEDQPDARLILEKILENAGHRVTSAVHGKDALEKGLKEPPDIIISDILMPVMDGFQFCNAVKNEEKLRSIPFIFYTATYLDPEDKRLAMEMGVSRYLIKPLDPPELVKILDEVIAETQNKTLPVSKDIEEDPLLLAQMCSNSLTKKLESKVRELEIYKSVFLESKNPTCVISTAGEILEINPAHHVLFNDTECQSVGHSFAGCLNGGELPVLLSTVLRGESYHQEVELSRQGQKNLHIDITASGIHNETGQVTAIIVISRDQTRRRESDNQLLRFRNMVDQSNDAFFIIDAKTGNILDANNRACTLYGYDHGEILQLTVLDVNPTYQRLENWHKWVRGITVNEAVVFETVHKSKSEDTFPVEISHRNVVDEENSYIIAVARDISERKVAEEQERKSQRLWARTFDSISDIITIQDLEHRITQCNRATLEILNLTSEECLGKHCYELFTGLYEPCPGCPIPKAIKTFEPYTEEVFHEKLGKIFTVNVSPIVDDDGIMTGISHVAKDITEQKKLAEQLQQAQKMESLGTLAGGIAHDFNNILSAIMGYTQLAQLQISQDSKAQEALRQVVIGGHRATELVKQILSFSRKTEYHMAPVDTEAVIAETIKLLRPSFPATIDIKQDIEENCPPILADAGQMHQIIMNLCTNAFHAMREQKSGVLEISLHKVNLQKDMAIPQLDLQAGEYLLLLISDTGSGMDKVTLEKIFDPYFTTKKAGEGTGLGLAVAHGIVRSFGGHISVYSEPAKGSCFKIYLPIPKKLPAVKEQDTNAEPLTGAEHLLVVDDEEPISNLIKNILERYGYQVTNTFSSTAALQIFTQNPKSFDLVITDYAMPQMNGIDLAKELLRISPDLPILLCTGFTDFENAETALQVGIKSCISKPMQADQLATSVRHLLDKSNE